MILLDDGFDNLFVPVKHVWVRKPRKGLVPRPRYPGYVFIGFDPGAVPWGQIARFSFILGAIGEEGVPLAISAKDMVKWVFLQDQRPVPYIRGRSPRRRFRTRETEIIGGPYEGRTVRTVGLTGNEPDEIYELFKAAQQRAVA
jgi:transcription antitermination factor NusG